MGCCAVEKHDKGGVFKNQRIQPTLSVKKCQSVEVLDEDNQEPKKLK